MGIAFSVMKSKTDARGAQSPCAWNASMGFGFNQMALASHALRRYTTAASAGSQTCVTCAIAKWQQVTSMADAPTAWLTKAGWQILKTKGAFATTLSTGTWTKCARLVGL